MEQVIEPVLYAPKGFCTPFSPLPSLLTACISICAYEIRPGKGYRCIDHTAMRLRFRHLAFWEATRTAHHQDREPRLVSSDKYVS